MAKSASELFQIRFPIVPPGSSKSDPDQGRIQDFGQGGRTRILGTKYYRNLGAKNLKLGTKFARLGTKPLRLGTKPQRIGT